MHILTTEEATIAHLVRCISASGLETRNSRVPDLGPVRALWFSEVFQIDHVKKLEEEHFTIHCTFYSRPYGYTDLYPSFSSNDNNLTWNIYVTWKCAIEGLLEFYSGEYFSDLLMTGVHFRPASSPHFFHRQRLDNRHCAFKAHETFTLIDTNSRCKVCYSQIIWLVILLLIIN